MATLPELIKSGSTDEIIRHLEDDPESINQKDLNGVSVIMLCAYYRLEEVLNHIRVNPQLKVDIFEAVVLGWEKKVKSLIAGNPALLNSYSIDGFQPLGLAAFFSQEKVAEVLLKSGADVNSSSGNEFKVYPIHSATAANSVEIVRMLLEYGADPNVQQQNGVLPIHSAAHLGNIELIKLLLNAGSEVDIRSDDGKGILDYAQDSGVQEEVSKLLEALN